MRIEVGHICTDPQGYLLKCRRVPTHLETALMTSVQSISLLSILIALSVIDVEAVTATPVCDPPRGDGARIIYASMNGGEGIYERRDVSTVPLIDAVADACSGDVIQLVRDDYQLQGKAITIHRNHQDHFRKPIIIRGLGAETTIEGNTRPGYIVGTSSMRPQENQHACLRMKNQTSIVIENVNFKGCWPIAIHAINSSYVTVRNSRIIGSTFGVYAQGSCAYSDGKCDPLDYGDTAHHYLIENVQWIQDPPDGSLPVRDDEIGSGNMWRRYWWMDIHDRGRPYHHLNGALFGSWNILGGVVFRNNRIHNAFNGIRLDVPENGVLHTRNLNIEIYGNRFYYIRDNSVEPEHEVTNLWVHGNWSLNAYASLSTDGVGGNYWYVFGNVHWFDEPPSRECHLDPTCRKCQEQPQCAKEHMHRRGKVLKVGEGPFPGEAFYIFHNSAYLNHPNATGGETRNLHVWNNAIQVCSPDDHAASECRNSKAFEEFCYHPSYRFSGNVTNQPGCIERCDQPGAARVCVYADVYDPKSAPIFADPRAGDLRLAATSPAKDAASPITIALPDGATWTNVKAGLLKHPDVGAYQGDRVFAGPSFVHFDPKHRSLVNAYRAQPRIVRVSREETSTQRIQSFTFSVPVYFDGPLTELVVQLKVGDTASKPIAVSERCDVQGRLLRCRFAKIRPLPPEEDILTLLPRGIKSARRQGLDATAHIEMTLWASVDPRICLQENYCPNLFVGHSKSHNAADRTPVNLPRAP